MKKFLFHNFSLFSPVSLTPLINIHSRISPRIFEKFEMVLMGYSGARGTLIYEKNLMSKISCQTPFQCTVPVTMVDSAMAASHNSACTHHCITQQMGHTIHFVSWSYCTAHPWEKITVIKFAIFPLCFKLYRSCIALFIERGCLSNKEIGE